MGGGSSTELGGVRVFRVSPGSPAFEAGLEVFFDFITEVNGTKMDVDCQTLFAQKIQESKNKPATLTVYNTRAHSVREVQVTPREWSGGGLLGATVRYDVVDPAENQGTRVLEVFPNSPAAHAGLVPFQDYILGTAQMVFHDIDDLVETVTSSINENLQVYVYNADSESVREVMLRPNNNWGGDGCIGCDIGAGLLHKIPAPRRPPGAAAAAGVVPAAPPGFSQPAYPPPGTAGMPATVNNLPQAPPPHAAASAPAAPQAAPGAQSAAPYVNNGVVPHDYAESAAAAVAAAPGAPGGVAGECTGGAPPAAGGPGRAVAGVTWPPPGGVAGHADAADGTEAAPLVGGAATPVVSPGGSPVTSPVGSPVGSPGGLPALPLGATAVGSPYHSRGASFSEVPRAPPGTPLNEIDVPPPPDLSALDPARFAARAVAASPVTSPPHAPEGFAPEQALL